MVSDIEATVRRTKGYWYEDGLTELIAGAIFGLVALLFAVEARAPAGSPLAAVSAPGLPLVIIVGALVGGRIVRALKERLTYPRTGYVAYRQPPRRRRWLATIIAGVVALAIVAAFLQLGSGLERWIAFLNGAACGVFMWFVAYTVGLRRFYMLGLTGILAGYAAAMLTPDETVGTAVVFAVLSAALVLSGALVLRRHMENTGSFGSSTGESAAQPSRDAEGSEAGDPARMADLAPSGETVS